ncbi:hypothetical protein EDB87DRAFT_1578018 [Lactarius vividus]|nr:hypothetical protein EDB87DRAFT_1578018 [Lactarius vividus]
MVWTTGYWLSEDQELRKAPNLGVLCVNQFSLRALQDTSPLGTPKVLNCKGGVYPRPFCRSAFEGEYGRSARPILVSLHDGGHPQLESAVETVMASDNYDQRLQLINDGDAYGGSNYTMTSSCSNGPSHKLQVNCELYCIVSRGEEGVSIWTGQRAGGDGTAWTASGVTHNGKQDPGKWLMKDTEKPRMCMDVHCGRKEGDEGRRGRRAAQG